jgi:hypothetical protein
VTKHGKITFRFVEMKDLALGVPDLESFVPTEINSRSMSPLRNRGSGSRQRQFGLEQRGFNKKAMAYHLWRIDGEGDGRFALVKGLLQ